MSQVWERSLLWLPSPKRGPLPCPHAPLGSQASPVGKEENAGLGEPTWGDGELVGTYHWPTVACQPWAPIFTLQAGEEV